MVTRGKHSIAPSSVHVAAEDNQLKLNSECHPVYNKPYRFKGLL